MEPASALFALVSELAETRPLRAASLGSRLGLTFEPDRSASNPYFHIYKAQGPARSPGAEAIVRAELREPADAPKEGRVNGLLILELSPKPCVTEADVKARFGANPELSIPSPHAPKSAPLYWVYRHDWGKLSLGFSRTEPVCLVGLTLDAIPPR